MNRYTQAQKNRHQNGEQTPRQPRQDIEWECRRAVVRSCPQSCAHRRSKDALHGSLVWMMTCGLCPAEMHRRGSLQ